MIPVRFYKSFSKRKNSTKRPAVSDAYDEINVDLKENATVETPSLVLTQTVGSASGNPVTVDASAGNMINPVVTFNPVQTGTGTPSPSNPRPIVPYTSINVDVNGNAIVIDLQGNKYGGVLNVATGVLTLKYKAVNLNTLTYEHYTTAQGELFRSSVIADMKHYNFMQLSNVICEIYETTIQTLRTNNTIYVNTDKLDMIDDRFLNTNEFRIWLSNNDVYVCYELATYETIQLTPAQVALVTGSNTVSVNGNSSIAFNYVKGQIELDYVYVYIPDFGKYYFCSSPTILTNYHVQYDLVEDYLASRKTEVGSTVAHIVYSSTGWDKDLTDARIGVKGTKTIYHDSQALPFTGAGCYIVGVVNDQSDGKLGALSYYRMDAISLAKLVKWMMNDDFFTKIQSYFNGKPMDFIQSCIWCPVNGADFANTLQTTFYLGSTEVADYSTTPPTAVPITYYPVTTIVKSYPVVSVSLGSKFGDFRDNQPYTSASLYLPGVGLTDLNANDFYESANVNIETIFDITTGDCTYKIYDDTNQLLKTVSFNASASVSLSQVNINSAGAIAGIGGAIGGVVGLGTAAITMNPLAGVAAGVGILGGASAAIMAANQRSTSIKGTNSGRSGFYTNSASSVVVRQDTEDCDDASYIARIGRPVGKTHAISNHSGYVQCEAASVAIAGDNTEREVINNYLNTGFYYE